MALENSRLLAASLTAAVLGAACSTPTEATPAPQPQQPAGGIAAETPAAKPQDPQGGTLEERVRDERTKALVAQYLRNAQGLRSNGDLGAAELELLRAKELAPGNDEVITLLRAVHAEQGKPLGTIGTYADQMAKLREIGEERARTSVQTQLQRAEQMSAERNFAGAIEELRVATLTIETKDEMEWGNLRQQVDAAKKEAETRYDEQQRQSQAELNAKQAEELRRQFAEREAR